MTIEAVLFDYSGVMTSSFAVPEDDTVFDRDAVYAEMAAAMMNESDHPWHDLERGEISLADFIADIESRVPGAGALFDPGSPLNVMSNLRLLPQRVDLVGRLRADGLRTGLVTNNVAEWEPLWRPGLPDDLFEVVIDSSAVGSRKPEPEIYLHALEALGVAAERTIFIDDFPWNLDGASGVGLHPLACTSHGDLDADLDELIRGLGGL